MLRLSYLASVRLAAVVVAVTDARTSSFVLGSSLAVFPYAKLTRCSAISSAVISRALSRSIRSAKLFVIAILHRLNIVSWYMKNILFSSG